MSELPRPGSARMPRRAALGWLAVGASGLMVRGVPAAAQPHAATELPRLTDLRQLAAQSRRDRVPVLLFFSTAGCPFCLQVRRDHLVALHAQGHRAGVLIREIEILATGSVTDLDGGSISESAFADRYQVRRVPHVELVDAGFVPLGKPLIGIDAAGFYADYLAEAIASARSRFAARAPR